MDSLPPLKIKKPIKVAGGLKAVWHSFDSIQKNASMLRGSQALLKMNQFQGFDCPGCAWPDPDDERSTFEFCENGAKAIAEETTSKKITANFFSKYSISDLLEKSDYWLGQQGRLTQPMILKENSHFYEPISWDESFQIIAHHLKNLDSPDESIFYTSGRTSNEAAFLYQLFVRQLGTNNLPDCSNLCHESSGKALSESIGIGKGTVTLEDVETTDLLMIMGQNPGTNHPRMLSSLLKAKQNGAQIIHVNPLLEVGTTRFKHPQQVSKILGPGSQLADHFLQIRLNGDHAFLMGLSKLLLEADKNLGNVLDSDFIQKHTAGFENWKNHLAQVSWDAILKYSGLQKEQIKKTANLIQKTNSMICCWAMGLTQHKNSVATIQEITNLMMLRGFIGSDRSGVCPVRGHSNVQGDRTVGIWEAPKKDFLDSLKKEFDFEPPRNPGYNVVQSIEAMLRGEAKVFLAMGGNFLSASSDTDQTAKALKQCQLTTHISTKLNRSHLVTGQTALILPCLGRTEKDIQKSGEQFVSVENSMGIVHQSRGQLKPASKELLSEPDIVCRLAQAVFGNQSKISWKKFNENYDLIRNRIEKVIPAFEDYNARVRQKSGFYLPNPVKQRKFNTKTGKAHFVANDLYGIDLKENQFLMMTIRSHDQFNTTIYGLDDRYRGIYSGRRVIFINPKDLEKINLGKNDQVDITSHFQGETRTARQFQIVPYSIPQQCVATYFPEANVLVPLKSFADKSHTPTSKSIIVTFKKTAFES